MVAWLVSIVCRLQMLVGLRIWPSWVEIVGARGLEELGGLVLMLVTMVWLGGTLCVVIWRWSDLWMGVGVGSALGKGKRVVLMLGQELLAQPVRWVLEVMLVSWVGNVMWYSLVSWVCVGVVGLV